MVFAVKKVVENGAAVRATPDGKVALQFGADVFPVTKREDVRLAVSILSAAGMHPRSRKRLPRRDHNHAGFPAAVGWSDAEGCTTQIGGAIWDDQTCGMSGDVFENLFPRSAETRESSDLIGAAKRRVIVDAASP